jgi:peptidoglycan/xylan/chitin deacetylase (PgdA/CDA1 family)
MDDDLAVTRQVLMYHSVEAYRRDPYRITVHPRRFDEQLGWLRRCGLRGVSMRELLAAHRAGRADGLVGLTFDDGYRDFLTEVMPALRRHGFTATVYVVAGRLGAYNSWDAPGPRKPLMTEAEVCRVAGSGLEVGSHAVDHVRLTGLTAESMTDQVRRSRWLLAELTGAEVSGFCYPYGAAGPREVAAVRDAGYEYACAVGSPPPGGRHALPRTYVGDRDGSVRLLAKLARHRLAAGVSR